MTHIKLCAAGASLAASVEGGLTSGMVGATYEAEFDAAWDGLGKVVVFRAGDVQKDALDGRVPHEVLAQPYLMLQAGVVGRRADGTIVIPTIWADLGYIVPGAEESGDPGLEPENPVWAQSAAIAQQALDTAQSVEQRADAGDFNGGYYLIQAAADGQELVLSYTGSKSGMEEIPPQRVLIEIPGVSPEEVAAAVAAYLEQHPVQAPVQSVNGKTGAVVLTAADVQAVGLEQLPAAINEALAQAKASGEFKGEPGEPGRDGQDVASVLLIRSTDGKVTDLGADAGAEAIHAAAEAGREVILERLGQYRYNLYFHDTKTATFISVAEDKGSGVTYISQYEVDATGQIKKIIGSIPMKATTMPAVVPAGLPEGTPKNVQSILDSLAQRPSGSGNIYELTINGTSANRSAASVMEAYADGKTIRATINGTAEIVTRVQRVSDTDCVVLLHVGSNAAEFGQNNLELYERGFQLSGSTVLGSGVTEIPIIKLDAAPPEATEPVYSNGFGGLVTLPSTEGPPGPAGPAGIEGFYSSKSAYPDSTCVKYCTQATNWNQNELNEKQGPEWQTPGSVILLAINCDNGNTYISIQEVVSSTRLQPKTYWISRKGDKGDPGQDGSGGGGSPGGSGVVKICDITLGGPAKKMVYDVGADTEYFMIKMSAEIPKVGNGLGDFKFWVNDLPVQQDWKFTDTRTNIINVCALPSETSVFGSFFFQLALWQNKNFGSAAREGNVPKTRIYGIETWGNGVLPTGSRLRLWGIK